MSKPIQTVEELDAVLHWRGKHAQAIRERDALQQRLTAADEQIDLLTPRHTEQPEGKRERFEKWVMATKHPVYGFLDGRSLARGDDRTGYADEYVQGLWVAYLAFEAEQPAPVAFPGYPPVPEDRKLPAPVAVALPERLLQVLKFLDGAENLDGHWFGEPHPSGSRYWWRAELTSAMEQAGLFPK